ncbi:hypothetical protein SELMODRAFT_413033 [Selaginella moellendorffii]|uniref:Uncharacterized protein n=1 Tax=Selaginella moellendorffii TaxID=88036 RepID=D8RN47_SELML|nr:hypothetical protein SELMODRAFT_413033 [Selaginella moellendorffii]
MTAKLESPEKYLDENRDWEMVLLTFRTAEPFECIRDYIKNRKKKRSYSKVSFLDPYLFVWILAVMVSAVLLGYYGMREAFQVANIASVSLPIAVGRPGLGSRLARIQEGVSYLLYPAAQSWFWFETFSQRAHHLGLGNLEAKVAVPLAIYFGVVFATTVGLPADAMGPLLEVPISFVLKGHIY